ncbi:MAG: glycosyltransferase family 4 protein [Verrucomicrobia bacterium]|nr:glycosyltransferase family 4 protein [Verrucomicrobiota bacterium]
MRFLYLIPAESRFRLCIESRWEHLRRICFQRRRRLPCGGVKVIYQHCDLLNQSGFEAHPVHLGDFTVDDWLPHSSQPITDREARRLATSEDVLVVPERLPLTAEAFPCRRKFAFVQNGGLVEKATTGRRYEDFGFTDILSCSNYVSEFMATHTSLPRHVVTNGIRLDLFRPAPEKRKANSVLYLKRKPSWTMGREAVALLPTGLQQRLHVVELPNAQSEEEMAGFYQQADIFVATGFPEGFALPPLEAMACGCAVVGFTGGGGLEHMKDGETALVAPDGDAPALSRALRRVLEDDALREKLRQGGMAKAGEFGIERMRRELVAFAGSVTAAPPPAALARFG